MQMMRVQLSVVDLRAPKQKGRVVCVGSVCVSRVSADALLDMVQEDMALLEEFLLRFCDRTRLWRVLLGVCLALTCVPGEPSTTCID
jgi:hypothetical protein